MHRIIVKRVHGLSDLEIFESRDLPDSQIPSRFHFLSHLAHWQPRRHGFRYNAGLAGYVIINTDQVEDIRLLADGEDITEKALSERGPVAALWWVVSVSRPGYTSFEISHASRPVRTATLSDVIGGIRRDWQQAGKPPLPTSAEAWPIRSARLMLEGVDITDEVRPGG